MTRLVYSTGPEGGCPTDDDRCPRCGFRPCRCERDPLRAPGDHSVLVRKERSGRKGKTVTVAGPFHLSHDAAARTLKMLKRACGCGGTLKLESAAGRSACQTMEIQGDQVDQVLDHLARQGFPVKRGG